VTTDRNRATHLILKKGAVSKTLVLFLAIKDQIVGVDWLRDSCAQRKFLSADGYVLTTDTNGVHQINYTSIFKMPNRNRLFVVRKAKGCNPKNNILAELTNSLSRDSPSSYPHHYEGSCER